MRSGAMRVARPVASSLSTKTPQMELSPVAGSNRPLDMPVMKRRKGSDFITSGADGAGFEFGLNRRERAINRVHEDTAQRINHEHPAAIVNVDEGRAAPRCAFGQVRGSDDARLGGQMRDDLAVIKGVVAERDGVGPGLEDGINDGRGHAESPRRILGIDDHAISLETAAQHREGFNGGRAPGATKEIAKEENFHRRVLEG